MHGAAFFWCRSSFVLEMFLSHVHVVLSMLMHDCLRL
jgi:hypothetical protein